ncbi:SHOCT domain-containing protein [Halomarina ordinaria]|uniref:SHOCT domain-containing protein n=1 Tax=Halomarina ordinaria TaxID=3033939 RepID=A0ABD5UD43_9EURY|nr:SHOCT domain-containing protein [Halomarina sp. PSRA2]
MSTQQQRDSLLWVILVGVALIVVVPILLMVFMTPMMGMMGWWGYQGAMPPQWSIGLPLLVLLVLLTVGYVIYRGITGGDQSGRDPALEELRSAYARGDLTDEEFETRRQRLRRDRE